MKTLTSVLFGKSPVTSLIGYAICALTVTQQLLQSGETNWTVIATGVLSALLGRNAADASSK
jgi:hypothetical protein